MQDESITLGELALLLLLFAGPVYLASAGIVLFTLRRRLRSVRLARGTVALALGAATLLAVPLTLVFWWASAGLPGAVQRLLSQSEGAVGFGVFVSVPALAASVISYGAARVYLARRARSAT